MKFPGSLQVAPLRRKAGFKSRRVGVWKPRSGGDENALSLRPLFRLAEILSCGKRRLDRGSCAILSDGDLCTAVGAHALQPQAEHGCCCQDNEHQSDERGLRGLAAAPLDRPLAYPNRPGDYRLSAEEPREV